MKKFWERKVCALLFLTAPRGCSSTESGICSVHRLFLDPESRSSLD